MSFLTHPAVIGFVVMAVLGSAFMVFAALRVGSRAEQAFPEAFDNMETPEERMPPPHPQKPIGPVMRWMTVIGTVAFVIFMYTLIYGQLFQQQVVLP